MGKTYTRVTHDEFQLLQYTGAQYGWELVDCSTSRTEIRESKKIYQKEQPNYSYKIEKRRVKNSA